MTSVGRDQRPGEGWDWRARAGCRGTDPEVFFPVAETGPERERAEEAAKAVCAGCPVRAQCLAWASEALPFGVAGGMTEAERAALRSNRQSRSRSRSRRAPVTPSPACGRGSGNTSRSREAGHAALAAGRDRADVARACGVSRRTVDRWAAALREHGVPVRSGVVAGGDR